MLLLGPRMERDLALMLLCCIILFIHFWVWDYKQNSVPNVWEVVFPNISIEGGVVHPNVHSLNDGPGQAVFLPAYNFKVHH